MAGAVGRGVEMRCLDNENLSQILQLGERDKALAVRIVTPLVSASNLFVCLSACLFCLYVCL